MSKWNKTQKQEIKDRKQREVVRKRKLFIEKFKVVTIMQKVNDGQATLIEDLRAEIKRLRGIDSALMDFNYKKLKTQREDFACEGLKEVIEARKGK